MGFMDFLSGMAKNPMTYYASSMLGGALGGPNSFGGRLSAGTMPLIANKAGGTDFLKMILGQGGKATMDKESVKINMPASSEIAQSMLGGQRQLDMGGGVGQGTMSGNMPVAPTISDVGQQVLGEQGMDMSGYNVANPTQLGNIPTGQNAQLGNIPGGQLALMQYMLGGSGNPFSSLGISAGSPWLTPEMLSQALQLRLAGEQFGHKQMVDQFDMMQKMQPAAQDPIFVQGVPGYGNLTLSQYKALPTSDREYVSHVLMSRQAGQTPLSPIEFARLGKDAKLPATAMEAVIKGYYREHGTMPPEAELKRWSDLFRAEPQEKTPAPMTWGQATNNLEERFGERDPTGKWVVTPELQIAHDKAQEALDDLREQNVHPLKATNEAAKIGRQYQKDIETKYFQFIQMANGDDEKIDKVNSAFFQQYGYIPVRKEF